MFLDPVKKIIINPKIKQNSLIQQKTQLECHLSGGYSKEKSYYALSKQKSSDYLPMPSIKWIIVSTDLKNSSAHFKIKKDKLIINPENLKVYNFTIKCAVDFTLPVKGLKETRIKKEKALSFMIGSW